MKVSDLKIKSLEITIVIIFIGVECGEPSLPSSTNGSTPRVAIISREVGGRAAFSCPSGHGLRGPAESICLPTGEWQAPFPTCSEVQCFHPGQVQNGYTQGIPPYKAGDVVQFNCNPEFMMQGQPIVACQDNGRWSGPLPKCKYITNINIRTLSLNRFIYRCYSM